MKSYLRMKYEQFLARTFDKVCHYLSKTRMDWYPEYVLGVEALKDRIYDLEHELDEAKAELEMSYHIRDIYEDYIDEKLEK